MKKILATLTAAITAAAALGITGCGNPVKDPIDDNYRVFYQIFVGSFSDSNGDGIGDLRGIINRMDYLNDGDINSGDDLGVQGIWLSPIFTSPSYHKYDAANYYEIDPKFGTEDDLKELISLCHERNVKIILDVAINHSSTQNDWFKQFKNARRDKDTTNPYYDFYTCVAPDERVAGRTYYSLGTTGTFYEGNFSSDMPEFNYDNPAVREETLKIAKRYLDIGVDGFRFDAIKYIYYGETEKSAEFWKWYSDELRKIKSDIYLVGECWSGDSEILSYYPAMNCFSFSSSQQSGVIAGAARGQINTFVKYVDNFLKSAKEKNENAMYVPFIANHDTDRAAGYLPPEQLTADGQTSHLAYMAANIYLLCSGSPIIYYGEEIGMKGTRGAANTDANRRLAMLWGDKDTVNNPTGTTFNKNQQENGTVKSQKKDKNSLLRYYGRVISFRNKYPEIARGNYTAVTPVSGCAGFIIEYNGKTSLLLHNVSLSTVSVNLSEISASLGAELDFIGQGKAKLNGGTLTVDAQTSVIIK